ncbi:hypothetical protein EJ04DRAFT_577142 [Polyplosphaeria fusca]|uniref:Uncharacterized protein n=1 Tax=Polyplosphaeria fusca TaxID=682080 RepID=A0A9P4QZL3_9PLEO|nr:hypothetical protein EJ04DRAFT_577142 [Polyplosphaeria fusca]
MPSLKYLFAAGSSILFFYLLLSRHQMSETSSAFSGAALGISLAADHGTVSTRQRDGTFQDIGRVDGDASYIALVKRLSQVQTRHPSPPYDTMDDQWNDQPRQLWRKVRKSIGLPASSEVAALSSFLQKLVQLAGPCNSVIISYPALPGLYQEDIADSASYLNLLMPAGNHRYPPHEIVAAYAGHGMGLCKSFTNKDQCRKEGLELPVRPTLLAEGTETAVIFHVASMREAIDLASSDLDLSISSGLGSPDAKFIPQHVAQLLRKRYDRLPERPKTITVILTGTKWEGFQTAIKQGVEEAGFEAQILSANAEFVAARGAAELAWRARSLQNGDPEEL